MPNRGFVGRLVNVLLVFMILLTAYNVLLKPRFGASDGIAQIGSRPEIVILNPSSGVVSSLTDEGAGMCRMVIVYDPNCSGCRSASLLWRRDLASEDDPDAVAGSGWHAYWLSISGEVLPDELRPAEQLVPHWVVLDRAALMRSVRLSSVPSTLLLDRSGAVVSALEGGFLSSAEAFLDDCTITRDQG